MSFKYQKTKDNLERCKRRKKHLTCRGRRIRNTMDFSKDTIHARRMWNKIFKMLKETVPT